MHMFILILVDIGESGRGEERREEARREEIFFLPLKETITIP